MATLILGAVDQFVTHTPPRPLASAQWVLEDIGKQVGAAGRVLASGAADIDLDVHDLDGDAGPTQASTTLVPLATTGALAPKDLVWIEQLEGGGEQLELDSVVADQYVRARYQLVSGYASGSTLRTLAASAAIPDAVTGDASLLGDSLRVTWAYELDGRPIRAQTLVCLQRAEGLSAELSKAKAFALGYFPQLAEQARSQGRELDGFASTAKLMIEFDLRHQGEGIEPSLFLLDDRANELIGMRMLKIAALNGIGPEDKKTWLDHIERTYTRMWDALTVGTAGLGAQEVDGNDNATTNRSRAGLNFGL